MKNLKKILLSMMVLLLAFAFIGCPAEPDPVPPVTPEPTPEPTPVTPEPTNNFNGKTFIGMEVEGEEAYFASYIIFTSDKDCEVFFYGMTIPATYTVADDVVTLTGTGKYAELQLSTTKLTNGTFKITIPPAVSGEEEDIVVSYAVGTLWTILYADEDFSLKLPEEELEYAVEYYGFVDGDYTKNNATKTITLTASGWEKVEARMGGGDQPADDEYIVMYNGGTFESFSTLEEFEAFLSELDEFDPETESGDYYIFDDFTVVLTDEGHAKLTGNGDDEQPDTWERRSSFDGLDGKWAKKGMPEEFDLEDLGNPTIIDSEEYFLIEGASIEYGIYLEMDYSDIVAGAVNNDTTPEEAYTMLQESLNQFFDNNCTYEDDYIVKGNLITPMLLEDVIFEDETGISSLFVNEKLSKIKLYVEVYDVLAEEHIYIKQ